MLFLTRNIFYVNLVISTNSIKDIANMGFKTQNNLCFGEKGKFLYARLKNVILSKIPYFVFTKEMKIIKDIRMQYTLT
jgi:hypothetical protein